MESTEGINKNGIDTTILNNIKYKLQIFDNYNYMEGSYFFGEFNSYGEALAEAKKIIEEHIKSSYKPGWSAVDMTSDFSCFGEEPIIISEPPQENVIRFKPRDYANEFAEIYFQKRSKYLH